jgi:hypothetical protein
LPEDPDYVVAKEVLNLGAYSVRLKMYPNLGLLLPFKGWNKAQPTKSVPWYDSYNKVKHDRGGNFEESSLINMVNSVAALHILLEAQYGRDIFGRGNESEFYSPFNTESRPKLTANEVFLPEFEIGKGLFWIKSVKYFVKHPI